MIQTTVPGDGEKKERLMHDAWREGTPRPYNSEAACKNAAAQRDPPPRTEADEHGIQRKGNGNRANHEPNAGVRKHRNVHASVKRQTSAVEKQPS
jgi:hypothetical protein